MSKIQEYGLACADAVWTAAVNAIYATGLHDVAVDSAVDGLDLAAIVAGVPLPEPEVAREPSGPGCSMPDREGWWLAHIDVPENHRRWCAEWEVVYCFPDGRLSLESPVVGKWGRFYGPLAPPTAAPETGEEKSR